MANIGYFRAASETDAQEKKKNFSHCSIKKYFVDIQNNESKERPQLEALINYIRDGDTAYVLSIYDLADNLTQFLDLMSRIHIKGAEICSLTEPVIDSTSADSKNLFAILDLLESFKRITLKRQQAEGISAAVAAKDGRYKGRIRREFNRSLFISLYNKWQNKEIRKDEMCEKLSVSLATLDRRISEYRKQNGINKKHNTSKE